MGRPRKSTALLELSGAFRKNPQRRRARVNEPVWNGPLGGPPEHFDLELCKIWQELAQRSPAGVLALSDRWFFEALCRFVLQWRRGELSAGNTALMWKMLRQAGILEGVMQ